MQKALVVRVWGKKEKDEFGRMKKAPDGEPPSRASAERLSYERGHLCPKWGCCARGDRAKAFASGAGTQENVMF